MEALPDSRARLRAQPGADPESRVGGRHLRRIEQMRCSLVASCWLLAAASPAAYSQQPGTTPRVFATTRADALTKAKSLVGSKDARVTLAYAQLVKDADKALKAPLVAVTDKHTL